MSASVLLINFCYQLVAISPCIWLCYLPFGDRLRRPAVKIAVESGLACVALSLLYGMLYAAFGFDESSNITIAVFALLGFLYYLRTVHDGFDKLLFVFCVAIHAGSIVGGLEILFYTLPDDDTLSLERLIISVLVTIVLYPLAGLVMYRLFTPRLRRIKSRDMKWMWVVPVTFFSVTIYYYMIYYITGIIDPVYPVVFPMLSVLSFVVYGMLLRMLDSAAKNAKLESDVTLINRNLDFQREQYRRLTQNNDAIKSMRHDLRHHLIVIGQLADSRNDAEIKGYVEDLTGGLNAAQDGPYCENHAVNAVASHYLGIAESEGVSVETRLDLPEDTGSVPAMDLCVIMGNFLENALEACRRMEHGSRFIHAYSQIAGDTLSIVVDNSFDGLWSERDGAYLSRKESEGAMPREGIGLTSVKAVCEKHQGFSRHEIIGEVWRSSALVHLEA